MGLVGVDLTCLVGFPHFLGESLKFKEFLHPFRSDD
jgi:hypothetical protein